MKTLIAILAVAVSLSLAAPAISDIITWTDDDGVTHFTDKPDEVPKKYREEMTVHETKARDAEVEKKGTVRKVVPRSVEKEKEKAYGGQTLKWWTDSFNQLKRNLSEAEAKLEKRTQYINVFEGGRRHGQVFAEKDVQTYLSYKEGIEGNKEEVEDRKKALEELHWKAKTYAVPRKAYE